MSECESCRPRCGLEEGHTPGWRREHGLALPPEMLGRSEDNVMGMLRREAYRIEKGLPPSIGSPTERFARECERRKGAKR